LKILALDTSTEFCSLALWQDGAVVVRETLAGQRHSELVLPMLDELLAAAGLTLTQLDGIAFGAGPGSFTGLRIACGVAQGLALGANLPVLGIGTLEALVQTQATTKDSKVIAALDARMGEIYHAAYTQSTEGWQPLCEPTLCLPQQAPQLSGDGWVGCGSGFDKYGEALGERYHGQISRVDAGIYPHAREIAQLAAPRFAKGLGIDPADAAPLYIRNKVALKESER